MSGKDASENGLIYVVDDDVEVLNFVSSFLREHGYDATGYGSSREAMEALNEGIDTVLADIKIPDLSGIQLLENINRTYPEMPVILMTGSADFTTAVQAIKKGAFDFIVKPLNADLLLHSVDRAVNYSKFRRMEKKYRKALEYTVQDRTMELMEAMEEIKKARDEAFEASRMKSEFCSSMSQKVLTPVRKIQEMMNLMADTQLDGKQREYMLNARRAANEIAGLIENAMRSSLFNADK